MRPLVSVSILHHTNMLLQNGFIEYKVMSHEQNTENSPPFYKYHCFLHWIIQLIENKSFDNNPLIYLVQFTLALALQRGMA